MARVITQRQGSLSATGVGTRESPTGKTPALAVLLTEQLKKNTSVFLFPEAVVGEGECEVTDVNFGQLA